MKGSGVNLRRGGYLCSVCPVDPCLSPEERKQVLQWLDESEQEFLKAIDDVSTAQRQRMDVVKFAGETDRPVTSGGGPIQPRGSKC